MASWQSHVEALVATGNVSQAAVHGLDGARWATTEGFLPTTDEIRSLIYAIDNEQAAALLPAHGVRVGGRTFSFLQRDAGRHIVGKSSGAQGGFGCVITRTTKCVVVAIFEPPISLTDCVCEVEKLADYLISMQM